MHTFAHACTHMTAYMHAHMKVTVRLRWQQPDLGYCSSHFLARSGCICTTGSSWAEWLPQKACPSCTVAASSFHTGWLCDPVSSPTDPDLTPQFSVYSGTAGPMSMLVLQAEVWKPQPMDTCLSYLLIQTVIYLIIHSFVHLFICLVIV